MSDYDPARMDTYDPARHHNQIVAVYPDHASAQHARDALVQEGVPASSIEIVAREASATTTTTATQDEGFWGAMKSLFAPDDDYHAYNHAVESGHVMVIVTPTGETDRERIIEALERSNPMDFDAHQEDLRRSGVDYTARSTAPVSTAPASTTPASNTSATATSGRELGSQAVPPTRTGDMALGRGSDERVQVVEERLRVGKREAANGAVRVRSYVVERPVEEQVTLHSERVSIDRQRVDRAVEPGSDAFRERTVEVTATSEEPVVSKEARVVEEIGVHKDVEERTETVRDTVRETKVEVEDGTKSSKPTQARPRV